MSRVFNRNHVSGCNVADRAIDRSRYAGSGALRRPGARKTPPIATGTRLPVSIIDRTELLGTRYLDTRWQALAWPRFDNAQNEGI